MRRVNHLLWSTTALAAAFAISSPAAAQDQPLPTDPNATAQQSPADPAQSADAPQSPEAAAAPSENAIVVTGLRRSLQSARNIKRNSDQIVDAVVAEDIGKLPDITVSDTAARIPGVQVERNGGEASRVLVRGLDNTFYTTTYDGRELFTAETRSVALQDFPAGAVAAIEAFKTSTANLIEPGISGLVNVRSRRPFDFAGLEVSGSFWVMRPNQSRDASVNGNLLLSDRWRMGDGEFGALVNFSYTRLNYQDSVRRHGFFIANYGPNGAFRTPDWPEIHYNQGERWRPSVNAALQYRSGDLELYADGLWQGYRERVNDAMWAQPIWGGTPSDLVFRDGTNEIVSGHVDHPGNPYETWGFKGATHRETNTYQIAVGGKYDAGPLRITGDIAHTYSHFELRTESVDVELNNNNYSVDWYTGYPGSDKGPTFQVSGIDPTDPTNYDYRGFFEDHADPKGKDWQARLDFEYDPRINIIPKLQWGVRYVDRHASDEAGSFYWNLTARNCCGSMNASHTPIPISAVPLDYELLHTAFRGDDNKPFPITWFAPTYNSVWNNLTELRQFNIDLTGQGSIDGPPIDPARSFAIGEKSLAGYAQANFRFDAGPTQVDGIVGLRAVRTRDDVHGFARVPGGVEPVDFKNSYTDWLPNANLNVAFSPAWKLRLAVTKTRTRPTFQQLNPGLALGTPVGCSEGSSICQISGSGGNPFLKPFTSWNYDASLEYYFSRTGFASIAGFHRDIKGFISTQTFEFPEPDPDTGATLLITGPVNTRTAKINGFEGQIRTFFDWDFVPLWARSFGIDANVTYINAKAKFVLFPDFGANPPIPGITITAPLPDVSHWSYNLTGMYERGPLSVRLSYNWRGKYPEGDLAERNDGGFFYTLQGRAHPSPRLDLSASYNISDRFTVFFDWTNILKKPFTSDIVRKNYGFRPLAGTSGEPEVFPMVTRFEETILSAGVRFNFGGSAPAPAAAPVYVPPPPPPAYVPPPPVEQPAPPPPPPAAVPERGS
jgi:TonB-dependent receptor